MKYYSLNFVDEEIQAHRLMNLSKNYLLVNGRERFESKSACDESFHSCMPIRNLSF
jgi:hypothetical protein